jgi:hypothetical protein
MNASNFPVSSRAAHIIVGNWLAEHARNTPVICHDKLPDGCHVYLANDEPCWWIEVPSNECHVLRGRRLIAVGKQSGAIYYDGPAGDEG